MRIFSVVCLVSLSICSYSQQGAKLEISKLTDDFYVFTTYRPYKGTPFPANGMYVITAGGVVMIDTPWDTTQFQPLLDSIKAKHRQDVVMTISTHSHEDRTAGIDFYRARGVKTFTSAKTDSISEVNHGKRAEFVMNADTTFYIGGVAFKVYYPGPGHTEDNIVIWFPARKILYGGCLVKSVEAESLGNVADADLKKWPSTIMNIKREFGKPAYVIPGHQAWTDVNALDHTLMLLRKNSRKD